MIYKAEQLTVCISVAHAACWFMFQMFLSLVFIVQDAEWHEASPRTPEKVSTVLSHCSPPNPWPAQDQ